MIEILNFINETNNHADDFEEKTYIVKFLGQENQEKKTKKGLRKISKNLIKLINIILNDYQIYPNYFHFFTIQNIYRTL